jgi:DNA-binding MarR family transcriptional regulator
MNRQGTSSEISDALDHIVEQWHLERPELDTAYKEVTGRIIRLADFIQQSYARAFEPLGITETDFGILVPLRRAGEPYQLTPTELARQRMISSGGATAAIDRLERRGLVRRLPNPADRRGSLVRLTDEGLRVVDDAMARNVEADRALLRDLPVAQRDELAALLRAALLAVEGPV